MAETVPGAGTGRQAGPWGVPAAPPRRRLGYLSGAPRVSTHPHAEASGPRSHVLGVITAFRDLGWEVRPFIVGDRLPPRVATGSHRALTRGRGWALLADFGRLALRPVNAGRAWRELGGQVDWVYERFATFQALGRPFQRRGIPWILETQGPFYEEAKLDRNSLVLSSLARRLELGAYRRCDVLICVSHALRDRLVQEASLPPGKVLVVPNGVDPALFAPPPHPAARPFDGLTIGYTGSLTRWQGLDLLLRAMRELDASGMPLHLVVIGDGMMRTEWETLAAELGLGSRVRFLGRVPHAEVPALVGGTDVGFAGHAESRQGRVYHSPLKIYEYLAMGKPVVASASEDALAVVRDGENGFVYRPGDLADLTSALRRAWTARERLPAMGRRARQEIVADHTWLRRAGEIERGVESVLSKRA
jgi:glycosyltransferase involved in cell wall biosynthesis